VVQPAQKCEECSVLASLWRAEKCNDTRNSTAKNCVSSALLRLVAPSCGYCTRKKFAETPKFLELFEVYLGVFGPKNKKRCPQRQNLPSRQMTASQFQILNADA
jgi:hypothetical protein